MFKKSTGLLLFGTLAIVALAGAAQQGVLLRRQLKADAKETYKIEMSSKQSFNTPQGDMDMEVKAQQTYTINTTKVDAEKGTADVDTNLATDKIDFSGSAAQMLQQGGDQKVPDVKAHAKLDTRNRLVMTELPKMEPMAAMTSSSTQSMMAAMFVALPEKEVKVGDTWDIVLPKNPFTGDVENKLLATLVGEKTVDGKKVWVISIKGQLKTDTNSEKLSKVVGEGGGALPDMTIKGSSDIDGEGLVDQATGQTISMSANYKGKSTVEVGMSIDVTGSGTMKMKLAQ